MLKQLTKRVILFSGWAIPFGDKIGKEVVTQITTTLKNNKTFYTDSSGRDFIERVCSCLQKYIFLL